MVGGVPVGSMADPARYRREVVGVVCRLHHLIGGLTAQENVEVPLIPNGDRRPARLQCARAALAEVGLGERGGHLRRSCPEANANASRSLGPWSAGRGCCSPTSRREHWDSESGREMLALLTDLSRRRGVTVLLVSHDPGDTPCRLCARAGDGHLTDTQPEPEDQPLSEHPGRRRAAAASRQRAAARTQRGARPPLQASRDPARGTSATCRAAPAAFPGCHASISVIASSP